MSQRAFFVEYTSDYGETWTISKNRFYGTFYPRKVSVDGRKVSIILYSGIYERYMKLYSYDLCETFGSRTSFRIPYSCAAY